MSHCYDDVNPCETMGHIYASTLVIRCPHREGYQLNVSAWFDNDDGDPVVIFQTVEHFGPFDDLSFIQTRAGILSTIAVQHMQAHTPA